MKKINAVLIALVPFVILVLLMQFLVKTQIVPPYLLPAPTEIVQAFVVDASDLWSAFLNTAWTAFLGFVLSVFGGIALGILFSSARWIERAFYPYAIFFQTVPIIAIAPLLVIWLGYGSPTVVSSALIVSIFPMIASTLSGLRGTDLALVDLFKLYGANRWVTLWKLRLPFALPQLFTGLRISAGLAVVGAIVGEFIAGGGLGGMIDVARARQRVDQVFAAILLASIIGLLFMALVNLLGKFLMRHWHPSEQV